MSEPEHKGRSELLRDLITQTRWIYGYARRYWPGILLFIALGVCITLTGLGGSLVSQRLIDAVIAHRTDAVFSIALLYALLNVLRLAFTALSRLTRARLTLRAANEIRSEVYRQFLEIDWQSSLDYHSGDLLTRVSQDVATVADSILGWLPSLITYLVQFTGILVVLVVYSPTVALLALSGAFASVLLSRGPIAKLHSYGQKSRDAQSELTSFYEESLQNLQAIKSFSLHRTFNTQLDQLQEVYQQVRLKYEVLSVRSQLLMSGLSLLLSGGCFIWGIFQLGADPQQFSFGTMVLFLQLAGLLTGSFSALVRLIPSAINAAVSAQRVMTILALPREDLRIGPQARKVMENAAVHGVSVRTEHLRFSYDGGRRVFEDFTLHAEPGEIIALVSPSGGGKTSFIRALLGLVAPISGSINLVSNGYCAPLGPCMRPLITYVAQEKAVFSGTIADCLRLSDPQADDEQLVEALKLACAWDFVSALPGGLEFRLKERGMGLSEGQLQRLAIARALLSSAPVMLLDEATSALDLATERKVLHNMLSHSKRTVIVTTHRPTVLLSATRVYSIEDGRARVLSQEEIQKLVYTQ